MITLKKNGTNIIYTHDYFFMYPMNKKEFIYLLTIPLPSS